MLANLRFNVKVQNVIWRNGMAKILVAFYNGIVDENNTAAMPIFYEGFIQGLDQAGNNVAVISHPCFGQDFGEIDEELKKTIMEFSPDICFIFNNCFFDLSDIVTCPIVIYEVDSPQYYSNKSIIKNNPDRFLYFVIQSSSEDVLVKQFGVSKERIFYVPIFSEVYADRKIEASTNIAFIGSKFARTSGNLFQRFLNGNPSESEKEMWKNCLNEIRRNPQVTVSELIYKYTITSELVARNLIIGEILQVLSSEKRIQILASLSELGLDLYGTENWGNEYYGHTELNLAYKDRKVYSIRHNQDILNSSKIGINVSHLQASSGFPWRVMDIMASNACLVTDYHSDFARVFPELDGILPIYDNWYDAYAICKNLIQDESKRKDIVIRCNELIDKRYRFTNLLEKMEQYSGVMMHVDK